MEITRSPAYTVKPLKGDISVLPLDKSSHSAEARINTISGRHDYNRDGCSRMWRWIDRWLQTFGVLVIKIISANSYLVLVLYDGSFSIFAINLVSKQPQTVHVVKTINHLAPGATKCLMCFISLLKVIRIFTCAYGENTSCTMYEHSIRETVVALNIGVKGSTRCLSAKTPVRVAEGVCACPCLHKAVCALRARGCIWMGAHFCKG